MRRVLLRLVVLLLVLAFLAHRFLPRYRVPWVLPLAVGGGLLAVRTVGWLLGE